MEVRQRDRNQSSNSDGLCIIDKADLGKEEFSMPILSMRDIVKLVDAKLRWHKRCSVRQEAHQRDAAEYAGNKDRTRVMARIDSHGSIAICWIDVIE